METEDLQLRYSHVRPEEMSEDDITILYRVITRLDLSTRSIDPIPVVEHLFRNKLVDNNFYDEMIKTAFTLRLPHRDQCEYFLKQIPKFCSLRTLMNALRETGYSNISRMIRDQMILSDKSVNRISRCDTSNRRNVQQFFKSLKRKVWNADFDNPLVRLRTLATNLSSRMEMEKDMRKRSIIGDKIGAVLSAEIDAHAITFNTELSDHPLFNELKDLIPKTSNTMVTDVILYGRLANACAIGKHFDMAENYLMKAKSCSAFMTPCLELANMVYCNVYVKLWEFEQKPREETRESLLQMAEVGIQCLEEEEEEIRLLWTRMFLLRMVFCILGIGNRATIIPNCTITESGILNAKEILGVLDQTTDNMDKRRRMFYFMARGRLYDIEKNTPLAAKYMKKALELAEEGSFKEKHFIYNYMQEIKMRENEEKSKERGHEWLDHSSVECDSFGNISNHQETDLILYRRTPEIDTIPKEISQTSESIKMWSMIHLSQAPHLEAGSFEIDSKLREMGNRRSSTSDIESYGHSQWPQHEENVETNKEPTNARLSRHESGASPWSIINLSEVPALEIQSTCSCNSTSNNGNVPPANEVSKMDNQLTSEYIPIESGSYSELKIESLEQSVKATQEKSDLKAKEQSFELI